MRMVITQTGGTLVITNDQLVSLKKLKGNEDLTGFDEQNLDAIYRCGGVVGRSYGKFFIYDGVEI